MFILLSFVLLVVLINCMDPSYRRVTTACINLDGHVIYRYNISGGLGGLAVDQQGHVYIGGADDIHRLSPDGTFRDIVCIHDLVDPQPVLLAILICRIYI
jgi:hypothetical protein